MTEAELMDGSALDEWIDEASLTRHSVTVYGKPGLVREFEDLERELGDADGERQTVIEARMAELFAEWQGSKATWVIEDASARLDDIRRMAGPEPILSEYSDYPFPRRVYAQDLGHWSTEYALQLVAHAVVEIKFADGRTSDGVTVEQLRKMRKRLGEGQSARLVATARMAMEEQPILERPQVQSGEGEAVSDG